MAARVITRAFPALALAAALAACSPIVDNHGYAPPVERLAEIEAGVDSPQTVVRKIGRPGLGGVIRQDAWYYVSKTVETWAWQAPKEIDRRVVAIRFGGDGLVASVDQFGVEDGRVINLVTRTTPTYGREMTILQQLFGNVGNFDVNNAPTGLFGN